MDVLEVSAKKVEDAITKACIQLGLSSDQLDIKVISEGSAGFLGIGSKPAVIQVSRKKEAEPEQASAAAETENTAAAQPEKKPAERTTEAVSGATEAPAAAVVSADTAKEADTAAPAAPIGEAAPTSADDAANAAADRAENDRPAPRRHRGRGEERTEKKAEPRRRPAAEPRTEEEVAAMKAAAEQFLAAVFGAMDMPVEVHTSYQASFDELDVDFAGEDMGILIGKRGQTLDSLQYLVSLVVNKEQKSYVRVKLDTENYRKRRRETLENLAKNVAYRVRRSGRPVSLEAMNPYERRIIHSALQGNRYVDTHSEGSEPYRHVVITLKK